MTQWDDVAGKLVSGGELSYRQAYDLMTEIMAGELGDIRLATFLSLLAMRGVATEELAGLADSMRDQARRIDLPVDSVDIVGTGGDQAHTVNISTMAAVVIAAAGTPVVKHGNRASTSASGSADVLEALGVNLDLNNEKLEEIFPQTKIAFLFANSFHPSMRHAAAVRRGLGFPTVFNVLGPLTNPARPRASAIGVANADVAPLVAGVFARRGSSAMVFRGATRGLDELTTTDSAQLWHAVDGKVTYREFDPATEFGMARAKLEELRGGSPAHNAEIARRVFDGQEGPITDAVALNAAAGLVAANGHSDGDVIEQMRAALVPAQEAIFGGAAAKTLDRWVALSEAD